MIGVSPVPVRPGVWLALRGGAGAPVEGGEIGELLDRPFLACCSGEPADRRLRGLACPQVGRDVTIRAGTSARTRAIRLAWRCPSGVSGAEPGSAEGSPALDSLSP